MVSIGVIKGDIIKTYTFSLEKVFYKEIIRDSIPYEKVRYEGCETYTTLLGAPLLPVKTLNFILSPSEKIKHIEILGY